MKEQLYEKMKSMFHLLEHRYDEISPLEMTIAQLARGNAFNTRVVGLEGIKKFRDKNPDCAITFKPNHLSEADFIMLSLIFRENNLKVVTEGGSNLFIDKIDIFKDLAPGFVNPGFKEYSKGDKLSVAEYLSERGAFKVFREPVTLENDDGSEIILGKKEILSLSRAYRYHLVENKNMYVTFPGYSYIKSGILEFLKMDEIKTGRSYTGRVDGFHHLPFLMDVEASLHTGVDVYIVDVNISYEPVLEDENFVEIKRLQDSGMSSDNIYLKDIGYVIKQFFKDKKKGNLCIKFGEPYKIDTSVLKDGLVSMKIKKTAQKLAGLTFYKVLTMQPIFPANIYFSAFDENFSRMSIARMKDKIDDIRDYLRTLVWGKANRQVDLHFVLDYNNHIISADEIINRTFQVFNNRDKQITALDGDMFVIYNKDVALQYKNHTIHFFKDFFKKEE